MDAEQTRRTGYANFVVNSYHEAGFEPRVTCSCKNIAATLEFCSNRPLRHCSALFALRPILGDPDFRVISIEPVPYRRICAEAQMMAMFGWPDHKMPALYIAKVNRD